MKEKAIPSFKLGIISIILFPITVVFGYPLVNLIFSLFSISETILYSMDDRLLSFFIALPMTVTAVFSLVYGIESINSPKRIFAILGILISLISIFLVITFLFAGACC